MVARESFKLSPSIIGMRFAGKLGWGSHPPHYYESLGVHYGIYVGLCLGLEVVVREKIFKDDYF